MPTAAMRKNFEIFIVKVFWLMIFEDVNLLLI